jgi:hypothetical protein
VRNVLATGAPQRLVALSAAPKARSRRVRLRAAIALALFAAFATYAPAMAQPDSTPADAAALSQLDRLVGTWDSPGSFVHSAYSEPFTARATTRCSWSEDRVFLMCRQSVTTGKGDQHDVAIYTYDPASKQYRFYTVSRSAANGSTIVVTPTEISYPSTFTDGNKTVMQRTVNDWQSPSRYTWRSEYSLDGGKTWVLMGSGIATKLP